MKERILTISNGGGFGNIGQELQNRGFHVLYTNTSFDDMKVLDIQHQHQLLHIAGAFGCNKNRKKAQQYIINNAEMIVETIDKRYPTQDIVFIGGTLGGGYGSGSLPILAETMIEYNPNKNCGVIAVLPSLKEPLQNLKNAVAAYFELSKIKGLKNIYIIDNNCHEDKFEINRIFAELFDKLVNITIPHKKGTIDPAELEELLTTEGNILINSFDNINHIEELFSHGIFTPYSKGVKNLGLLLKSDVDLEKVEQITGASKKVFTGYSDEYYLSVIAGTPFPTKRIEEMAKIIELKESNSAYTSTEHINIPKIKDDNTHTSIQKPILKREKVDFSKLFSKYMD